ncbi:MAG: nickel pincer cofactor biosynthesis protein LarC [bacterium]|nr:nickel pincer cofactor biosynthesis protein LarC [bacterium]
MKIAYFDCFAGISGDMILGALIDAGLSLNELERELGKLNLPGYTLEAKKLSKNGITGTKLNVIVSEEPDHAWGHRTLGTISEIINNSGLDDEIKQQTIAVFTRLGEVEAAIHGTTIEKIHFHEVGAVDSIVDITGAVIGLKLLGINEVHASPVHLGTGFTRSMHGKIPVPAPATAALLKEVPVYSQGIRSELTTPTGAALLTHYAKTYGPLPGMKITATGYGAGTKDLEIPNLLRVYIGETGTEYQADTISMLETNIDDMNPEFYEYISARLLKTGALDVYIVPVIMKKSRPGAILTVLLNKEDVDPVLRIIFRETSTSGVRISRVERKKLEREIAAIETRYGDISIKIHKDETGIVTISPEYEDCKRKALEMGIPLKEVYNEAQACGRKKYRE